MNFEMKDVIGTFSSAKRKVYLSFGRGIIAADLELYTMGLKRDASNFFTKDAKTLFDWLCIEKYGMCECTKMSSRRWLNKKLIRVGEI